MKVISVKKLVNKKFKTMGLSEEWQEYFGDVADSFEMILWGPSFAGKSSFINAFVAELARLNPVLYVALEEGISSTTKNKAIANKLNEIRGLRYANHETTFETLMVFLSKKRSPKVIILDSLQYMAMSYIDYKKMKEAFPRKTFIFISHAKGKNPDGKTAEKIRYDAGIKVRVESFIAFIESRYGGHKNYVIWEQEAKRKFGVKTFKKHLKR